MRRRLFLSTLALATLALVALAICSNVILADMVAKRQADYEEATFSRAGKTLQSVVQGAQATIDLLFRDPKIRSELTDRFDSDDPISSIRRISAVESAVDSLLISRERIDSVIFLGANGFSCICSLRDILYDTRILGPQPSPESLSRDPLFSERLKGDSGLCFFGAPETEALKPKSTELAEAMKGKLYVGRTASFSGSEGIQLIFVTIKTEAFGSIIAEGPYQRRLEIADIDGRILWTHAASLPSEPALAREERGHASFVSRRYLSREGELLYASGPLGATGFTASSWISSRAYFSRDGEVVALTVCFALGCAVLALLSSWWFSRRTTHGIEALASQLDANEGEIPERMIPLESPAWERDTPLRRRLYLHFGISVLTPLLLFCGLLSLVEYRVYESKIVELDSSAMLQMRLGIDEALRSLERLSLQAVFDADIQAGLDSPERGSSQVMVRRLFDIVSGTGQGLLAFQLYDRRAHLVASSLPFDAYDAEEAHRGFTYELPGSNGALVVIGAGRMVEGLGPALVLGRKIMSAGPNFGSLLGYFVLSVDQEALILKSREEGSSGFSRVDLIGSALQRSVFEAARDGEGDHPSLLFDEPLSARGLSLRGTVSLDELTSRLWPFLVLELTLSVFVTCLCAFAAYVISRQLGRPLRRLRLAMASVEGGDFDLRVDYEGQDEIEVLTRSFNRMVDRLNQLVSEVYESQVKASRLLLLEREAQLSALQQQINPHFLYNTLDSIQWMAYRAGATEISRMATALGRFFRGVVHGSKGLVSVAEELDLLSQYLVIQRIRFGSKLRVELEVSEETLDRLTLKLLLQPLVENALVHGIEPLREGGSIIIRGEARANRLFFEVKDDGIGMEAEALGSLQDRLSGEAGETGVGLANVVGRLRLQFEEDQDFRIESSPGQGTRVTVSHPLLPPIGS
jgi:Predicted signal transduction protein with a C-terminal ATPase domain